jgi:hypothetical protein
MARFFFSFFLSFFIFIHIAEANIVLKVIAANPSKGQVQKVPVKAYLPKEVKPEDIVDKGDLEIAYDTQQGSYYVYNEYEVRPGEFLEKDIEIRNIWIIPSAEIESLYAEAKKIADLLKNTEYAERSLFLNNSIEAKLKQITDNQNNPPPNPERLISDYRDNLKVLESVRADIVLGRGFLAQAKPGGISGKMIWRMIIIIVIFLGLLGASFYFIWQKQLKVITGDGAFYIPKEDAHKPSEIKPEHREATENKPEDKKI